MDDLLAGLLRGEALDHRALKASGALAIHDAALVHDILPLVADRLAFAPELPVDLRESFMEDAHRAAAVDLAADLELRRLLEAFAAGGVRLLLIKGSHLAYTHFDRPDLRARIDSDVLISLDDRGVADAIITTELGYTAPAKPSGDFTATQKLYVKTENAADVHIVDLHWRLTSPQAFAHVLSFEELYASSVAVPALGRWARGPSNVHALVIACMHRVAHHHDEADQFKWLYDIHLLASGLAEEEWDAFARFVLEREVAAVCLESLERSARWFHTVVPGRITADQPLRRGACARGDGGVPARASESARGARRCARIGIVAGPCGAGRGTSLSRGRLHDARLCAWEPPAAAAAIRAAVLQRRRRVDQEQTVRANLKAGGPPALPRRARRTRSRLCGAPSCGWRRTGARAGG